MQVAANQQDFFSPRLPLSGPVVRNGPTRLLTWWGGFCPDYGQPIISRDVALDGVRGLRRLTARIRNRRCAGAGAGMLWVLCNHALKPRPIVNITQAMGGLL